MTLPDPKQVKTWGGKVLVDREGQPIGTVTQVYTDDDTGLPEWAATRLGELTVFLPLQDAVEADGQIRVQVRRDDVAKAPLVVDKDHLTQDDEARLYRYYGIPFSPVRSRSGLPVGEGPVPTRLQVATASARAVVAETQRRLTDPPTLRLLAVAGVLAAMLWVNVRRGSPSRATRTMAIGGTHDRGGLRCGARAR
jgi:hypothetical protein